MCSHYQAIKERLRLARMLKVDPEDLGPITDFNEDMWPRRGGVFLRRRQDGSTEATNGRWGIIPFGTRPEGLTKAEKLSTFNARSETAETAYTFRGAWKRGQRCIVPAEAFYEPDWRSGRAVPTRFRQISGEPVGIAGLWDQYVTDDGEVVHSYTMLTINADTHEMFRHYHQAGKEKRMVVILPPSMYHDWLDAPVGQTRDFLQPYPAELLVAEPVDTAIEQAARP